MFTLKRWFSHLKLQHTSLSLEVEIIHRLHRKLAFITLSVLGDCFTMKSWWYMQWIISTKLFSFDLDKKRIQLFLIQGYPLRMRLKRRLYGYRGFSEFQ